MVFWDASQKGYVTCVYVVNHGKVEILCSKAKIIPVRFCEEKKTKKRKQISIPQAELLAAELRTQLWQSVSKALHIKQKPVFWSDRQTALWWIKYTNIRYKVFVTNRVEKIWEVSDN
jgi:hypothetical protein